MTGFLDKHPLLVLVVALWMSGWILLFVWTSAGMLLRFITQNSLRNQNLWLVGLEVNWIGGLILTKDPGRTPWRHQLPLLGTSILMMALNSLLMSWIGLVLAVIGIIDAIYRRLTTPSKIRELSWRARNVQYRRAEDYMQLNHECYLPGSAGLTLQDLEAVRHRVEGITRDYAERVFEGDFELVDKYIKRATELSKKRFDSEVIHPTFWMIPLSRMDAERAIRLRFKGLSKETDEDQLSS